MSAITVGGDLVHYEVLGRGRAVVLLHGWIGSWRCWVPSMQQLHLKYKVYALDLFGFGDSAKNARRYPLDEQVRMVLDFLQAMELKKVALIGHGLGAWIGAEVARRAPEAIARMMLIGAPLFDPGDLGSRKAPPRISPKASSLPADIEKTIYDASDLCSAPLASLGRGGYDDKPDSRPRQPKPEEMNSSSDPTVPNTRLINRARLEEAARAMTAGTTEGSSGANTAGMAAQVGASPEAMRVNENNPLYKLLSGQEPAALLNRCLRKFDPQYEKLTQDVSRTDARVLTQTAAYYDPGAMLDTLRALPMPVMLVHGDTDPLIAPPDEAVWNYLTQDSEELCVPVPVSAGHFPMYEYGSFPRLLGGFLDAPDISKMEIKERWRRRSR